MGTFIDLTGKRFGKWTVLAFSGRAHNKPTGNSLWHCRCDCGKEKPAVMFNSLTKGTSTSCGCSRIQRPTPERTSRRMMRTIYEGIKTRCHNKNHPSFKNYGARGITICHRWLDSFDAFLADVGPRPSPSHSLDRFPDPNGNYEPSNVRWATRQDQQRNRRSSRFHPWKGQLLTITDIARAENVAFCSLRNMIVQDGLHPDEAVALCRSRNLTFKERARCFTSPPVITPTLSGQ